MKSNILGEIIGKPKADSEGNERIPPDGFDTTALEATLHGRIPPPHPLFHNNKSRTRKGTAFLGNTAQRLCDRCVREDTKQALKGNLQADGVQSRQTLFCAAFPLTNPSKCDTIDLFNCKEKRH